MFYTNSVEQMSNKFNIIKETNKLIKNELVINLKRIKNLTQVRLK